nr:hypothetical protein [Motilibacter aurantiacus]
MLDELPDEEADDDEGPAEEPDAEEPDAEEPDDEEPESFDAAGALLDELPEPEPADGVPDPLSLPAPPPGRLSVR